MHHPAASVFLSIQRGLEYNIIITSMPWEKQLFQNYPMNGVEFHRMSGLLISNDPQYRLLQIGSNGSNNINFGTNEKGFFKDTVYVTSSHRHIETKLPSFYRRQFPISLNCSQESGKHYANIALDHGLVLLKRQVVVLTICGLA